MLTQSSQIGRVVVPGFIGGCFPTDGYERQLYQSQTVIGNRSQDLNILYEARGIEESKIKLTRVV